MKKIFTLTLAALFVSLISFAADRPRPGKITVTSFDNAAVIVKIDGRNYNMDHNSTVLDNLRPGFHTIEIFKFEGRGFFGGRRLRTIYSTNMFVAQSQLIDVNIGRFGQVNVQKSFYGGYDRGDDRGRGWGDNDHRNNDRGYDDHENDRDRDHRGGRY